MNGLTKALYKKPDADKADAVSTLEEVKALRNDVSDGLGAIRVLLAAMLEELRKEQP